MSRKPADRRDALKAMFAGEAPQAAQTEDFSQAGLATDAQTTSANPSGPSGAVKAPSRSGAVKAMGL